MELPSFLSSGHVKTKCDGMTPDRAAHAFPLQAQKVDLVVCITTIGKSYLKLRREGSFDQLEGSILPVTALI